MKCGLLNLTGRGAKPEVGSCANNVVLKIHLSCFIEKQYIQPKLSKKYGLDEISNCPRHLNLRRCHHYRQFLDFVSLLEIFDSEFWLSLL